jgi:uncharacterized protein (TIGR03437 family)
LNAPWGIAVDDSGNVFFADSGNNAIRVLEPVSAVPVLTAVVNAASNQQGAIAPGEMVTIYGSGIGPLQLATGNGAGVSVTFNDIPAMVLYASATQVSAVVPGGLIAGASIPVIVQYGGASSAPLALPVAAAAPAIFTENSLGAGQAIALNADGSLNGAAHPASPGATIVLSATGIPAGVGVTVTIGGEIASVQFDSVAAASTGLAQLSVTLPQGTPLGNAVPIALSAGGAGSQPGVTIAVGTP